MLAALALAGLLAGGGTALASAGGKGPVANPGEHLNFEKHDHKYRASFDSLQARYAGWLSSPTARGLDPRALQKEKLMDLETLIAPSLEAATGSATPGSARASSS